MRRLNDVWFYLSIGFALLMVARLSAQGVTVSYAQGDVDVQNGRVWSALSVGDALSSDAIVRLGHAAYVEITDATGTTIAISQTGDYSLRKLLAFSGTLRTTHAVDVLASTFKELFVGFGPTAATTEGVRGANESRSDSSDWVESEAQSDLVAGRDYLAGGEYDKAIKRLKTAFAEAADAETPEIRYTLSYAYALSGDGRDALAELVGVQPAGSETWASDFVLLKSKLLIDTFAFERAASLLVADSPVLEADGQRSSLYHFLLGLAYRGLGEVTREDDQLARIANTSDHSELATTAEELLKHP